MVWDVISCKKFVSKYDLSIQTKLQTEWFVWEGEKLIHLKLSSDFGDEEIK